MNAASEDPDGLAVMFVHQGRQMHGYAIAREGEAVTVELEDGSALTVPASGLTPVPGP